VDAVGDPSEDVFDLTSTQLRREMGQLHCPTQGAVRPLEPAIGPLLAAQDVFGHRRDVSQPHQTIGFVGLN
jgi:hypothetical protein